MKKLGCLSVRVGKLTAFIESNAIIIVTTGTIGGQARRYANHVMRDTALAIVMLDGRDLDLIEENSTHIADVFNREAQPAMKLKILENGAYRRYCEEPFAAYRHSLG